MIRKLRDWLAFRKLTKSLKDVAVRGREWLKDEEYPHR